MGRNKKVLDFTHLSWSLSRQSSGTAGSYLKSYEVADGIKYYYKMSNFDSVRGVIGHESINEIIVQNIAEILEIPHLHYELIHGEVSIGGKRYETWLTKSRDFKDPGERKLTFESFYEINRMDGESVWQLIERNEMEQYFYEMFLLDYIICNRDRHGANIEVLEHRGAYRLAPLFDHGISLLAPCMNDVDKMKNFDLRKDGPVNNFVGSMNLSENLKLVPNHMLETAAGKDFSREHIFAGLEEAIGAVPEEFWNIIEEMVRERINHVKEICNQG